MEETKVISARVSLEVAKRLEDDAAELGQSPGTLLRHIIEGRYGAGWLAQKARRSAEKNDRLELV